MFFWEKNNNDLINWLFSKILILDRPGVLINQSTKKIKDNSSKRLVFEFEEIIAALQKETIKKLGKKRSFAFWYWIGRDWGYYYLFSLRIKSGPVKDINLFFKEWCKMISKNGTSLCEKVSFEESKNLIILEGKDNLVCRLSKEKGLFLGVFVGFLTFLKDKPIKGFSLCTSCPKKCKMIFEDFSIEENWKPPFFEIINSFKKLNFPEISISSKKVQTAQDFLKFKKLSMGKKGKFELFGRVLIPFDQTFNRFLVSHFLRINEKKLFADTLINESEKIAKKIIFGKNLTQKIISFENIFSVLGQGIPYITEVDDKIRCILLSPPIDKNTEKYQAFIINGYLNYIFGKKLKLLEIKLLNNPFAIKFSYS